MPTGVMYDNTKVVPEFIESCSILTLRVMLPSSHFIDAGLASSGCLIACIPNSI